MPAPPPTRGWTLADGIALLQRYGSPAHAGMDPPIGLAYVAIKRLPRPRGDGPELTGRIGALTEAPPPTRGWTRLCGVHGRRVEGSPAHAGMDPA